MGFVGSRLTASLEAEVENLMVELEDSSLLLEAAAKRMTVARRDILEKLVFFQVKKVAKKC